MWKMTFASLRSHKRRLLGTSSAVLLGVAFLAGTLVLGDTIRAGFTDLFEEANAGTDAVVRSSAEIEADEMVQTGLLEADLVDQIAQLDGVASAAPLIERSGQIIGADGDPIGGNGPPTIAGNWVTDEGLNPYEIAEGRAPERAGEVVIDRASADTGDLHVGDETIVRVPDPVEVTVVGIATFGETDGAGGATYTGFTTETAQELLLPAPNQLTGVLVAADDGLSQSALVDRIETVLPDDVEAITGAALTAEQEQSIDDDFLGFFENFLVVFAGIALVVASFSIYNTFSIVVAQRTQESALLRALGASRRQILTSVVVEALLVGVVASAVGVLAGLALAEGLHGLLAAMGFDMPRASLVLAPSTVIISSMVGVVVTVLSSVVPAVKASRVLPLAALRDVAIDRSAASRWRALTGFLVTGAGGAMAIAGATAGTLPLTGGGALAVVVGTVLLGPVVARPVAGLLGAPLGRLRGMSGRLSRRNAMRNPRRTASTASALMVGVAVVSMFTVVAASLKAYVDATVDSAFTGDLVVVSENFSGVGLSPEMAGAIADLPEVEVATGLGNAALRLDGQDTLATPTDGSELAQVMDLDVQEGAIEDLADGTMAVSESRADDEGWTLGTEVPVAFADGATQTLRVAAIYAGDDLVGPVLISQDTWAPHALQAEDVVVVIGLVDGVSLADGEAAVQTVADQYLAPDVQTQEEYVASVAAEVDQLLAIIYVLLLLAIIIALMGIANTLSLSIHERTRELGLLRAVGQSRRQLRSMVRGEALIVSTFGTVGGVGLGCFLGWALVKSIGEEIDAFAIPVGQLAVVMVVGAVVGLLAALRPARRAAKLDVLGAIATS